MPKPKYKQIRKQIIKVCRLLSEKKFVAATDGNVSARISKNEIIITPSGINKAFLKKKQLVVIDMKGKLIKGKLRPSSELNLHLEIYKKRPDINSIIHAHPPLCIAFSITGKKLDPPLLPEVALTLGKIPIVEYATPTTNEVAKSISGYINDFNAIILQRHGSVTYSTDLYKAYNYLEKIEHAASIAYYANVIGEPKAIKQNELDKLYEMSKKIKKPYNTNT